MKAQRWMWIAWPAFLMAGVLEMLLFAFVDPAELHWHGQALGLSREAVYTLTFFVFWGATTLSSALTTLLAQSPFEDRIEALGTLRANESVALTASVTETVPGSAACGLSRNMSPTRSSWRSSPA